MKVLFFLMFFSVSIFSQNKIAVVNSIDTKPRTFVAKYLRESSDLKNKEITVFDSFAKFSEIDAKFKDYVAIILLNTNLMQGYNLEVEDFVNSVSDKSNKSKIIIFSLYKDAGDSLFTFSSSDEATLQVDTVAMASSNPNSSNSTNARKEAVYEKALPKIKELVKARIINQ